MRFDATLKTLFERYPFDLPRFLIQCLNLGLPHQLRFINADVSTVTAAGDQVIRVGGRRPWLFHLELQSSHKHLLDRQLLLYNVLLVHRHKLPVRSAVLLLRPEADRASLTGELRLLGPDGGCYLTFHYDVLRLWQLPVEPLLTGSLGLLPLAPMADVPERQLPVVIARMEERIDAEAESAEAENLWASTYFLLGVRFSSVIAKHLMGRLRSMKESSTYQATLAEEASKILLRLGTRRFGEPEERVRAVIEAIEKPEQLELWIERLEEVANWSELLDPTSGASTTRRRSRRRP